MDKSLTILLISILICGMICIQPKKNSDVKRVDYIRKISEGQNSQDAEKSSIAENNIEQAVNYKVKYYIETSYKKNFKLRTLRNMKKAPIVLSNIRLLSNDNNSQENHYENQSNGGNSNCSTQHCQTCVSSTCTACKLDSNGQQKYLLINGRCFQTDNETSDNSSHNDEDHQWEDHEHQNEEGHVSYGGRKYRCDVGCKNCSATTNFTQCSACIDGFALNSTSLKCMKCDDKCVTCSQDNLSNCTTCYPEWTLDGPDYNGFYTCTKCLDAHCGQCSSVDNCTSCKNFYYLSQTGLCQSCLPNCRICTNSSSCNQCFSGYFVFQLDNGTQSCNLCVSGCANCSNLTTCFDCYPGYFMNTSTKTCEKCSQNCWLCNSSTNCLRCVIGTHLVNNSCVNVIEDCAVMSNGSTCGVCFEGYQLSSSGAQCIEKNASSESYISSYSCGQSQYVQNNTCMNCTISIDNCQKCNSTSCRKCKPQYFLTNNGLSCTLCSSAIRGCKNCDNSIFCQQCADGYYMEQDKNGSLIISYGNCLQCSSNCQTCNENSIYCTSCSNGYLLTTARICVPPNQFNFTLLLNLDLNQFPSKIQQFRSDLSNLISDQSLTFSEKSNFVQITNIASGSILVEGTISAKSSSALQSTLTNFNTALSSGSTFSGIYVLSSKTEQHDQSQSYSSSSYSQLNTGVIIGVVVGVVCAIIIIIIIIVYCCCCRKPIETVEQINLDEKRSSSTNDYLAANVNLKVQDNDVNAFAISNPSAVGPQYFA